MEKEINTKKSKKSIIIIIIMIAIIIAILCACIIRSQSLTKDEKIIYDIVYKYQTSFKKPASVHISEAKIFENKYAIIKIGGENSFGAIDTATYYMKDDTLYTKENNYEIVKEIINKCFEAESNEKANINELKTNSISKINKKLEKRYK